MNSKLDQSSHHDEWQWQIGYGLAADCEESVVEGLAYLHHRFPLSVTITIVVTSFITITIIITTSNILKTDSVCIINYQNHTDLDFSSPFQLCSSSVEAAWKSGQDRRRDGGGGGGAGHDDQGHQAQGGGGEDGRGGEVGAWPRPGKFPEENAGGGHLQSWLPACVRQRDCHASQLHQLLLAAAAGFDLVHQVGGDLTPRPQVLHQVLHQAVHVTRSEVVNDFFLLHGVTATWALTEQVDLVTTKTLKSNTDNRWLPVLRRRTSRWYSTTFSSFSWLFILPGALWPPLLYSINRPGCRSIFTKFDYYYLYTRCIFKTKFPEVAQTSQGQQTDQNWVLMI